MGGKEIPLLANLVLRDNLLEREHKAPLYLPLDQQEALPLYCWVAIGPIQTGEDTEVESTSHLVCVGANPILLSARKIELVSSEFIEVEIVPPISEATLSDDVDD